PRASSCWRWRARPWPIPCAGRPAGSDWAGTTPKRRWYRAGTGSFEPEVASGRSVSQALERLCEIRFQRTHLASPLLCQIGEGRTRPFEPLVEGEERLLVDACPPPFRSSPQ